MVSSSSAPHHQNVMWDPVKNLKLKRILGSTISGRFSLIQQPKTSNLIYIAGCVVVIFDTEVRSQRHLFTSSKQPLTTLSVTSDGRFLAAASCSGQQQANIYVWDINRLTLVSEWKTSNSTISCMSFSNNGRILVLAGDQRDPSLSVWDWRRQWKVATNSVDTKIRAITFANDDRYFVTVGHAHVMYWKTLFSSNLDSNATLVSCGGPANLGEQKKNSFCDAKWGRGSMSSSLFCITNTGLLCEINGSRLLHKWVDLRVSGANCLTVSEEAIAVGCSNGIVRCFNTQQLRFLRNLPRPFNSEAAHNKSSPAATPQPPKSSYPDVSSIVLGDTTNLLSCQYADKSLYVWDLSEFSPTKTLKYCGSYHSSCIWGLDTYPSNPGTIEESGAVRCLPELTFITCSSDDSVRIWNPSVLDTPPPVGKNDRFRTTGLTSSSSSDELLRVIFTHDDLNSKTPLDTSTTDSTKINDSYDNNYGLRCLRVAPDGRQLAIGSRSGIIKVYNLERHKEVKNIAAHDAEVLCLEYSEPKATHDAHFYLASSSRDKLIHIFDASDNYNFLQTIDDHSSSITALKFFTPSDSISCLQLISCGADFKIIIRNALLVNGQLSFTRYQQIEGKSTFYDMVLVKDLSCIIAGCQDSMIRVYDVAQAEYMTGFESAGTDTGAIIKLALDPSSTFLATSSTDKSIRVYDYQRAACIATIDHGLSDLVTDMKFSQDGRHLVACSGDGCIFIWELPVQANNSTMSSKLSSLSPKSRPSNELLNVKTVMPPTTKAPLYTSITSSGHSSDYETPQSFKKTDKCHIIGDQESEHYSEDKSSNCNENLYDEINQPERGYKVHKVDSSRPSDMLEDDYVNLRFSSSLDLRGQTLPSSTGNKYTPTTVDDTSGRGFYEKSELLKSRDSLDLITRRQRYVSDNLMHVKKTPADTNGNRVKKAPAPPPPTTNHYQSLRSARSYVSQSNDDFRSMTFADPLGAQMSNQSTLGNNHSSKLFMSQHQRGVRGKAVPGRQLERMSTNGLSKSMNLMMDTRSLEHQQQQVASTDEEDDCSSDYDNNRLLVNASNSRQRSVTPPKPSQHRQFRRNSGNNTSSSLRNYESPPQTSSLAVTGDCNKNNSSSVASGEQRRHQQPLKVGGEDVVGRLSSVEQLKTVGDDQFASADHCKSVAQELEAMSRYASELHQMLLRSDKAGPSLCNLIETAAQSSIALLSGILLSNNNNNNNTNTNTNNGNQRDYEEHEAASSHTSWRRASSRNSGSSSPPPPPPSQHQPPKQASRTQAGQHQLLVSPPPQQNESMLYSKKSVASQQKANASNGSSGSAQMDKEADKYQQPLVAPGKARVGRGGADLANLDKVLEAYSDRLFKMVQERMVESAAAAAGAPTSTDTYHDGQRVNNNERLGQ